MTMIIIFLSLAIGIIGLSLLYIKIMKNLEESKREWNKEIDKIKRINKVVI